ncbi:hypothetical protein [Panacagrimonas sp.]|uniref:hypothetical protein n=1 Tax=Panacagrimonas sp. TaxID=2480088 RepID=UPI003B52D410
MTFKKLAVAAALSLATVSAHAAPGLPGLGTSAPAALTALGRLADPVLQPMLAFSAPLVGGLVRTAPPVFLLLGDLTGGVTNAFLVTTPAIGRPDRVRFADRPFLATLPGLR